MASTLIPAAAVGRGPPAVVTAGEDCKALAWRSREAVDVGARGAGKHDARAVIVRKYERALECACGEDRALGVDAPAPLSRRERRWLRDMILDPLDRAIGAAVVDAEDGRTPHDADVGQRPEFAFDR